MAAPTNAGRLKSRVRFEKRSAALPDAYGTVEGDWVEQFTRRAEVKPLKGAESVIAARLQGRQPAVMVVRRDSETKAITTDWRAVEIMPGDERTYNIRGVDDMERDNRWITLLCEAGVADG